MKITGLRAFMTCDRDRPRVIVAFDTDEGITGWGECYNHGPIVRCRRCWSTCTCRSRERIHGGSSG